METQSKPRIVALPNGPLYFIGSGKSEPVPGLVDAAGSSISTLHGVSLCRCGQSKNKPFCDVSHIAAGFSGQNLEASQVRNTRKNYVGRKITVHDNRRMCSHSAECIQNLESVFDVTQRPWINADGAKVDEIVRVVKRCPSGALSYSIDGVEYRDHQDREPKILVSRNGPYLVTGGIELEGVTNWAEEASQEHYALCRCGASENKPFCDGNHLRIRFQDGSA